GELLEVSPVTASRAMNILAKRGLLVRRRRQGTFIGAGVASTPSKARTGVVHYLSFFDELPVDMTLPLGKMLAGLREVQPDVTLNVHTLPLQNAVDRLQQ